ncbi:MAG TPA: hypothetical protein VMD28_02350 [Acidimicrobiales bacterium]|nr:hypothetical protein [Acidimicrobiales bacterium]
MFWTGERIVVAEGTAEGSLADWASTWDTSLLGRKVLAFHLGDRQSGPLAFFTYIPCARRRDDEPRWRWWARGALARVPVVGQHRVRTLLRDVDGHFHRSDTFRMVVGEGPQDWLCFNGERVGIGDYRVQPANEPYQEWYGRTACIPLVIDADRRGHPPIHEHLAALEDADAVLATVAEAGPYTAELGDVHLRDSQAVTGVASSAAGAAPGRRLRGSVRDEGWTSLPNGSRALAIGMGRRDIGPLIVLSRNPPGAVEAPASTYRTEMLRLVLEGGLSVGDRRYRAGDWRLSDAGVAQGAVTHGPEGSVQLVLFADRQHCRPVEGDAMSGLDALLGAVSLQLGRVHVAP